MCTLDIYVTRSQEVTELVLTCPSLNHHLSGRDPSAHSRDHHRVEAAWFESVETVFASLTGDTFIFDDHIFMDQQDLVEVYVSQCSGPVSKETVGCSLIGYMQACHLGRH